MTDEPIVDFVNRHRALAITRDGSRIPITHWIDDDGNDCQPDNAVSCVAEYDDKFITIDLRFFQSVFGN